MISNWDNSFAAVMKSEGCFSDDPRDPGNHLPDGRPGCTNLGVTQRAWERYVGRQVTHDEMRALNLAIVQPFYKTQYWNAVQGDKLPRGVDYLCFDLAVNGGPARAAMTLQQALGITADGVIGMQTTNAAAFAPPSDVAQKFTDIKIAFYKSLANPTYERGWINRANEALALAKRMASSA